MGHWVCNFGWFTVHCCRRCCWRHWVVLYLFVCVRVSVCVCVFLYKFRLCSPLYFLFFFTFLCQLSKFTVDKMSDQLLLAVFRLKMTTSLAAAGDFAALLLLVFAVQNHYRWHVPAIFWFHKNRRSMGFSLYWGKIRLFQIRLIMKNHFFDFWTSTWKTIASQKK